MMPKDHIKILYFKNLGKQSQNIRPDPLDLERGTFIFVLKNITNQPH